MLYHAVGFSKPRDSCCRTLAEAVLVMSAMDLVLITREDQIESDNISAVSKEAGCSSQIYFLGLCRFTTATCLAESQTEDRSD
jgi:hypothetical protein